MASKSMVFYQSWLETAKVLPDPKDAIFQLIEYGIEGRKCHSEDLATQVFFDMATPNIDSNEQKKLGGAPKGNQNAKGHGAPKGNSNAKKKQTTKTNNLSDVNVDVNVDDNEDINSGRTALLEAGAASAEELDAMLAQINAGDDDG